MFVDLEFYFDKYNGKILSDDDKGKKILNKAIKQVNRIANNCIENGYLVSRGEPLLTNVKEIICEHAEFLFENIDKIEDGTIASSIASQSINGVSVNYAKPNSAASSSIVSLNGVYIQKDLYEDLIFYGLCYRGLCR